jgi:chromate reductase, NAD(P)H dehydrogenase (quinone)
LLPKQARYQAALHPEGRDYAIGYAVHANRKGHHFALAALIMISVDRLRSAQPRQDQERNPVSTTRDVAVFVGSLRKESFNRKLANALIAMAPAPLKLEIVEIRHLPLYNQDDDANPAAASATFKARVQKADAVLFVTPEYNRSVPGVLKNAIDVASRPYGKSAWDGKPGAVISLSPGVVGGFGANHHLRQSLVFLNVPAMP